MRSFVKRLAIVFVVLAISVVGFLWFIVRTPPTWYAPPDPENERVALMADRVEYGIVEQTRKARPTDDPWALRIDEAQINAWLSARLRAWARHEKDVRWPDGIGTPQVNLQAHQVSVALPVSESDGRRVVVAELAPSIQGGSLWLHLVGLRMGRISLPGDPVESLVGLVRRFAGEDESQWARVIDLMTGREPIEPVLELSDGRIVRMVDLKCRDAAIEVTCRTITKKRLSD